MTTAPFGGLPTLLSLLAGARVYDLEQPRHPEMPVFPAHKPGYFYMLHRRHGDTYDPERGGPRSSASGLIVTVDHTGTHIDAVCHQADAMTLYGGVAVDRHVETPAGFTQQSIDASPPLVTRGVLLDVAGFRQVQALPQNYEMTPDDLVGTSEAQGVSIQQGDVVFVRTGFGSRWERNEEYLVAAGMGRHGSEWLAGQGVRAVGSDNMAWDVIGAIDPEWHCTLPGHLVLLARSGIQIMENLNLEELAQDRCFEFALVCSPIKWKGATGSPVRPLAIRP